MSAVGKLTSSLTKLSNATVYWSKVAVEVGKIVYKKEALAPPSSQQFQQVYQSWIKFVKSPAQQKQFLEQAGSFQFSKACAAKAAIYGTQLLAFFSLGEIIGRRHIVGYPSVGGHQEHH
ncbi:ATP synthase subunit G atp20 [Scheffersomyces spartinae]|uniref:ATP synthase subunit G atp20 n=1 Tax=Scheffersomyces spartinae TaxID=45513 RepID=A0A9P8ALB1_9ASCO|nr:ATP synthase subunit G atp20 [Scheffersomyces spartinae]KAG7195889.1 ATP synthase subunit G atp20 [Scheffersomyces spartinae]